MKSPHFCKAYLEMLRRGGKMSCRLCRMRWSNMRTLLPWGSFLVTKRCLTLFCLPLTERKSCTLSVSNPSVSFASTSLREVHLERVTSSCQRLSPSSSGKSRFAKSASTSYGSTTSLTRLQLRAVASVVLWNISILSLVSSYTTYSSLFHAVKHRQVVKSLKTWIDAFLEEKGSVHRHCLSRAINHRIVEVEATRFFNI
ncbi:hypothetical protein BKA81DRAFT_164271 [Phyllosticta paracitricarpa]